MILTLSCEEASRLTSDAFDRDLTRSERWALRLHMFVCGSCRRLAKQLETIRALLVKMPDGPGRSMIEPLPQLSAERKEQIKRLLDDATRTELG